jgi:hypothetical protein
MRAAYTRRCWVCHAVLPESARPEAKTCSARCRQRLSRADRAHERDERMKAATLKAGAPLPGTGAVTSRHVLLDAELKRLRRQRKTVAAPIDLIADELRAAVWLAVAQERCAAVWTALESMGGTRSALRLRQQLLDGLSTAAASLRQVEAAVKQAQARKP